IIGRSLCLTLVSNPRKSQVDRNHKHYGKERHMEEAKSDQKTSDIRVKRKKRKWLNAFGKFLMYGGFMLIIMLGFIIYIVIRILIKKIQLTAIRKAPHVVKTYKIR